MRTVISRALKVAVSAALLGWAVHQASGQDWAAVAASIEPAWIAAAVAVQLLLTMPLTARWRLVARRLGIALPFPQAWRLVMVGQFFNQTLPSSVGGDAMRVWLLSRRFGKPLNEATTSMFADRLLALVAVPLFALAGWILVPGFFRDPEVAWVIWPLVALVLAGAGGIRRIDLLPTRPGLRRSAIYRHVQKGSAALRMLSHDPIAGGVGLALSVVITAGVGLSVWLSARAAGVDMGLIPFLVVTPMVMLIAMIPVTISGWGLRESAMVAAFSQLGADAALILAGSVLYGLAMIIVGGVGGVLWIAERGGVWRPAPVEASSAEAASTSTPRSGA